MAIQHSNNNGQVQSEHIGPESDGLNLPARFDVSAYLDKVFADAVEEFDRVIRFGTEGTPGSQRPVNPINDYDMYRRL